ncbi:putative DNA-binding transcriptional regulator YafY [Microvirga flocculans]|uniref:Putative DNA-binding transcriptional regulator YafY n=1 Tax=Microvirga flocculans TaxID=217168 RepID=A0A7W6IJ92_9HYPH|nr:YafY family protein [Microvirga flocculans]MBB4041890.1 putative DNA-binding transcriptional regulator YafY [Microvirga flocculans]
MRRADRLFDIVQMLRGGRLRTAQDIAEHLEVSVRTIYRDIDALIASGVPIEGERGVGYILRGATLLPPLSFSITELQALALGAKLVRAWADQELAQAAEEVLAKVDAVIPVDRRQELWRKDLRAFGLRIGADERSRLSVLRQALRGKRKVALCYADAEGAPTERLVRPLSLEAWGHAWTLTAWCELRQDFRAFRLDRILEAEMGEVFRFEPGRTLQDYMARLQQEGWDTAAP